MPDQAHGVAPVATLQYDEPIGPLARPERPADQTHDLLAVLGGLVIIERARANRTGTFANSDDTPARRARARAEAQRYERLHQAHLQVMSPAEVRRYEQWRRMKGFEPSSTGAVAPQVHRRQPGERRPGSRTQRASVRSGDSGSDDDSGGSDEGGDPEPPAPREIIVPNIGPRFEADLVERGTFGLAAEGRFVYGSGDTRSYSHRRRREWWWYEVRATRDLEQVRS